MKKFFKALALALALTLVLGSIPASAATSAKPVDSKTLYVGGTAGYSKAADGTITASKYKKYVYAHKLLGLTKAEATKIKVSSSDKAIALAKNTKTDAKGKITRLGKVWAQGIGDATITLKYDGNTYNVPLTVKKSATEIIFGRYFVNGQKFDLELGKEYELSLPRSKDGAKLDTDARRLIVLDKDGNEVSGVATEVLDKNGKSQRLWTVKFDKPGEYKLVGEAFQSNKYNGTTATGYVDVVVGAGDFFAEASKAKEIKVTGAGFTSSTAFTVKKGALDIKVTAVKVDETGTIAYLTLDTKLGAGDYTVSDGTSSATFTAVDEYVKSIVVFEDGGEVSTGKDSAGRENRALYVHYDVLNQYDESVRKYYSVTWTSSYGGSPVSDKKEIGLLTFEGSTDLVYGNPVVITGVYTAATGAVTVTANVKVGLKNSVGEVVIKGVVDLTTKKVTDSVPADFQEGRYALLIQMKDRLGYEMKYDKDEAANLSIVSTSPLLAQVKDNAPVKNKSITVDGVDYAYAILERGNNVKDGGVANIQITSSTTGKQTAYELKIDAAPVLAKFDILAPDSIVANGETVELGFTALDIYDKPITSFAALVKVVTLTSSNNGLWLAEKDDGSAKLVFQAPAAAATSQTVDGTVVLTSVVTNKGYTSTSTLKVKYTKHANAIQGMHVENATAIVEGGFQTLTLNPYWGSGANWLYYYDQYERSYGEWTAGFDAETIAKDYRVCANVKDTDLFSVTGTGTTQIGNNTYASVANPAYGDGFKINAIGNVASTKDGEIEFFLAKPDDNNANKYVMVSGSEKTFTYTIVDISNVSSFEIETNMGEIKNNADTVETSVKAVFGSNGVKGKLANGKTIYIPYQNVRYTVKNATANSTSTADVTIGNSATVGAKAKTTLAEGNGQEGNSFFDQSAKKADGTRADNAVELVIKAQVGQVSGSAIVASRSAIDKKIKVWIKNKKAPVSFNKQGNAQVWNAALNRNTIGWTNKDKDEAFVNATGGEITADLIKNLIDNGSDNYNNYSGEGAWLADVTIEITEYKEAAGRHDTTNNTAWEILNNTQKNASIKNAEIGDTFTATLAHANGAKMVVKFTVGADTNAWLRDSNRDPQWY